MGQAIRHLNIKDIQATASYNGNFVATVAPLYEDTN